MAEASGIVGEYLDLRADADADVLAMQLGDFYEFFCEDAELVAEELDLKLTEKRSGGERYPMAGVPVAELTPYLKALVERGYRVAVADQHETDDGHVRELARVVTPGTLLEPDGAEARYLAAVVKHAGRYGIAFADVTTGRFHVTTVDTPEDVHSEVYRFDPVEVLPGPTVRDDATLLDRLGGDGERRVTEHDADAFAPGRTSHAVAEQFGEGAADSLGLDDAAVRAAGAVLDYVAETGLGVQRSMTRLTPHRADDHVVLDATTQRNLELAEPMGRGEGATLLDVIDHTVTSAGSRRLAAWVKRPRRDADRLERRQNGIAALVEAPLSREAVRETLEGAADLERLASRAVHGSADARALLAVRDTLGLVPELADRLADDPTLADSPLAATFDDVDRDRAADLRERLEDALADDPESDHRFRRGYDDELDDVVDRLEDAREWVDSLAARERERHGLGHLSVDRNRTDGYYLQVGKSEADAVPEAYREIKTLKNAKRFTTDALESREREILRLEARREALERELFEALRERVADAAGLLQAVGRSLSGLDVRAALAEHAAANGWTRPELGGDGVAIEAGRHPVVEQTTEFVPNDLDLGGERRFLVVTGPNMSGKSTYLRQAALVVLLAQIGSFVPADAARIGLVDGIFTRVGALDELAEGRSTFMVEMQELSNILHAATEDSLVVLDEVGRGTATYDGISIAWAATEYLHNEVRALTMFATHYHELTGLADHLDRVANVHVAATERDGDVTFLRTVREGATDRSYGIHVAELAGVPAPVVERAREVLDRLRREQAVEARGGAADTRQVVFDLSSGELQAADGNGDDERLDADTEAVLDALREVDLATVTPAELMTQVEAWQRRLDGES
ncbi:MAG: DNA mismatch repair protein MutS [Halobacteriales archaeon]